MAKTASANSPKPQVDVSFAMRSDCGRSRRTNQDCCAALPQHGAFVVCDRIGGAAAGEVASRLAADAFLESLRESCSSSGAPSQAKQTELDCSGRLVQAIEAANDAVFRHSRRAPQLSGMGTTLVAALQDAAAGMLWLANVGDSRCYRLRGGTIELLTEDHSLVEEQVKAGTLSRAEAAVSPIRNIITRAIGSLAFVEADIASHRMERGDLYLLASEGLTRELEDDAIAGLLLKLREGSPGLWLEDACQALIDAANQHGGRDNITVLLIAFG